MAKNQQSIAAKAFAEQWAGKGYEKGDTQSFWLQLLQSVFGVANPFDIISFEIQVKSSSTNFIDAYIEPTHVLIEQKSIDKDLRKAFLQSDGSLKTPFEQAKCYSNELPFSRRARWVVICNFKEFHVYDMENLQVGPEIIELKDLEKEYYRLQFLVENGNEHLQKEMEVSLKAGEIIGEIYDELLKQYVNPDNPQTLRSLNILCVRLVFCLYAEDAGLFGEKRCMFHDYLAQFKPGEGDMRDALIRLFETLDTPIEQRSPYLRSSLKAFPYCNGGLFADRNIDIPFFNDKIAHLILKNASDDFDWSLISPTIFGAVFESTLNPETRRSGGMHYTSIENIHKVIDPLFLDDLKAELASITDEPIEKKRVQRAREYQDKLASLKFLDPACGSGNFLTETYLSLRRLENEVMPFIGELFNPIKVNIHQFYGIEINDFAVSTATTALWIAEAQMMAETEKKMHINLDFLPLKSYNNIREGNALRMDWNDVVPASELNYIMGNPPFVGNNVMSKEQREDILPFFKENKTLDYVAAWFIKAAHLIQNTSIHCAFVSTNSITQGEQVPILWKPIIENNNISINFAWRTFRWDSEASIKAHVHCVIIGFSVNSSCQKKHLFNSEGSPCLVNNINAYLLDAPNIFVSSRSVPLCNVEPIRKGNQPTDGGNLIIEASDYDDFIQREPLSKKYIKKLTGAKEYINNLNRYCLWLVDASPSELKNMPFVMERIRKVREMRAASTDPSTRRLAETPTVFRETNNPETYIIIPSTSSENRRYIPLGFLDKDVIPTNSALIIPSATILYFGILTSNVHMAWMRAVCGRLEMRYRYSKDIVYNNFPWPSPTDEQKARIEQTAQGILDARAKYPDCSLADLYDELTMPVELRKAHQENDKAVMDAYGFNWHTMTESDCVAELFKMYQKLVKQ